MLRIVDCLTLDHELSLILLAGLICLLGCTTCMIVGGRVMSAERSLLWMSLLSLCAGCTAWSTHFIAMLAYQTSVPISYDFSLTVLSLLVGTVVVSIGFLVAFRLRGQRLFRAMGGVLVGSGVAALHYIGMDALRFPGSLSYDMDLVVVSLVATTLFGALSVDILFDRSKASWKPAAGGLMLLMILSLHFVGMSATRMELGFFDAETGVSRTFLIAGVTLASLTILTIGIIAAIVDQRVSGQLAAQAERFRVLADGAFEGLIVHRDLTILDTNLAARKLLGLDDNFSERCLSDWSIEALEKLQMDDDAVIQEIQVRGDNGTDFPAKLCRRAIMLQTGEVGEMIAIRDLTQRRQSEARIAHLALHDTLTDLPNRRLFNELANSAIARARQINGSFALLAMDLDNFKTVNDMYGHAIGDELIQLVARRMSALLGDGDVVARLGGDEFSLLSISANQPEQGMALANRIHDIFKSSIELEGAQLLVEASIGIAVYPMDGDTLEDLMRNADTAMYESKAEGKATTRFFEPRMNVQLDARRALESRLRQALELDALTLNYQPLVSCSSRSPVCFEALLRWTDAELGSVSPVDFIPVAEQTGLIVPIGEFVLRQACRDAASWPEHIRVAVNLSVAQFGKYDIVGMVRDALESSGISGKRLELEITESLLMENQNEVLAALDELKALGVRIAMDDFGTGYSSLSYLQSFSFNKLKIDRAFVSNLENNPQNASIVEAVVSMGKSLQMRVVAEGVETSAQADILSALECDELQGYLISRPMQAADVQAFLDGVSPYTGEDDSPSLAA
ncbi:bifunctional diguanylate cyclase/phosphodiesterase [Granulosicoccus sp. 3-233]|uniref:bifunctional diguanylate cyclase/phosphodiesterase n=1 Tax=Granulosicoccus sp. 3-233 TaxID=3417969 RepID=UPI003D3479DA